MALRLADAEVLPLDYGVYGREIGGYLDDLKLDAGASAREIAALRGSIARLASIGTRLGLLQQDPARLAALTPAERERVNESILRAERDLCDPAGLPDRPWFKHLVYACRYTYLPLTLPGLTEAVERKDDAAIAKRSRILAKALDRAARRLE
jgi:N-acetylated-alpha-linked acidic dipeptidase